MSGVRTSVSGKLSWYVFWIKVLPPLPQPLSDLLPKNLKMVNFQISSAWRLASVLMFMGRILLHFSATEVLASLEVRSGFTFVSGKTVSCQD